MAPKNYSANSHDHEASGQVAEDEHGDGAHQDDGHVGLARLGSRRDGGCPEVQAEVHFHVLKLH